MTTYQITLETASPLVIAARHVAQGGATQSLDHIPGSALRGALASAVLHGGHSAHSPLFQQLFGGDAVRYGNCYPALPDVDAPSWPLPATAWTCKLHSGFRPAPNAAQTSLDPHGVVDTLTAQLAETWALIDSCPMHFYGRTEAPVCGASREPISGYYVRRHNGSYSQVQHTRRLITRTAIAGRWQVARQSALYTIEAIEESQSFVGFLHVEDSLAQTVLDVLDDIGKAGLTIGLGRTRGLGWVRIADVALPLGHLGLEDPLAKRWLTPDLSRHDPALESDRFAFGITLYSDAILLDDYGRYQPALSDQVWPRLIRYASAPPAGIAWPTSIRYRWGATSAHPVYSWRFAPGWQKRASEELAVTRGSVFVFTALRQEQTAVLALLERLEAKGIGRRRNEGFGQIVVGHPWHDQEQEALR